MSLDQSSHPFISVVIPCRNEEKYIYGVLRDIYKQDYPKACMEVLVVDGMSDDRTKEEVKKFQLKEPTLQFYENPRKIVPTALNIGIKKAKGEVIVRIDAHCEYPENYLSYLVDNLIQLQADNVGVAMIAHPRNSSLKAAAISEAISSVFGIGDSYHRTGLDQAIEMDSVPFGCYRREVFEKIGYFDEELVRNQDDEFNARLRKAGGKIWLLPDVEIKYYARDSIAKIAKMFYYYGFFKPLVNKKVGSAATLRQFVPPLFLLSNIFILLALIFQFKLGLILAACVWIPYLSLNLFFSFKITLKQGSLLIAPLLSLIFMIIHLSYGYGYLSGWLNFVLFKQRSVISDLPTNR